MTFAHLFNLTDLDITYAFLAERLWFYVYFFVFG